MNYIFPNPKETIKLIKAIKSEDSKLVGEKMCKENPIYEKIMEELNFPFHKTSIKLNQCSKNLNFKSEEPNVLYLSDNEGCFARTGISIKEKDNQDLIDYPDLNYIDLVLNEDNIKRGELQIFTHELGHVMMNNIIPQLVKLSKSVKQHCSAGITDYFMAFFEGWGEHFERTVYDNIEKYRTIADNKFDYKRSIVNLWNCEIDSELRVDAAFKNKYIYKKLIPQVNIEDMSIEDVILLHHASSIFDRTRILNAQEMLSCEGVIATLFYRINTNEILQNNYMTREYYKKFLIKEMPEEMKIKEVFTPYENVILKNFIVWNEMKNYINEEHIPFIEYIKIWMKLFPEDSEELIRLFISTTVGQTATSQLAEIYEKIAYEGMIGNMEKVVPLFKEYSKCYSQICDSIEKGKMNIDDNIGREIWIQNKDVLIREVFWVKENKKPLMVNLNTAAEYDLMSFPGIQLQKAKEIIKIRNKQGYFTFIEEVPELNKDN